MENHNLHLFSFLILFSISVKVTFSQGIFSPFGDIACSFINCGQGTCMASNNSVLGTIDFHCGNESPSAPPPPASLPPRSNQTNHCDFIWCGDGKCATNGTGHICQCNQGSENLFNSSDLACFKPCYFGADCQGLGLDLPLRHPQPPPPPPSSSSSGGNTNGLKGVSKCTGTLSGLIGMSFLGAFLPWF